MQFLDLQSERLANELSQLGRQSVPHHVLDCEERDRCQERHADAAERNVEREFDGGIDLVIVRHHRQRPRQRNSRAPRRQGAQQRQQHLRHRDGPDLRDVFLRQRRRRLQHLLAEHEPQPRQDRHLSDQVEDGKDCTGRRCQQGPRAGFLHLRRTSGPADDPGDGEYPRCDEDEEAGHEHQRCDLALSGGKVQLLQVLHFAPQDEPAARVRDLPCLERDSQCFRLDW
mmetsp:Transcript_5884/g.17578  ORF Transcript_5884/g.17578 Transcript_5884/m.17578 type:complete len:227 (+) Transcript_5884:332-1012(+)